MKLGTRRLDYKWVIIAVCFLIEFVVLGFCSGTRGLFLAAVTDALDLKRSLFSVDDSLRFITQSIIYLFFGNLLRRYGAKKMIAVGTLSLCVSLLIYSRATQILSFYVGGVLFGAGMALTTSTMVTTIIRRWCSGPNVGKILGVVLGANGVGAAVATQMLTPLIYEEGNVFGYRNAYLLLIPFALFTGILALLFIKDAPGQDGAAMAPHKKKARGNSWPGITYEQAKRTPYFYTALLCVLLTGMMLHGMGNVSSAHMLDVGLTPETVAAVASIGSLLLTGAKFITGASYDRFGLRVTAFVSHMLAVLAMVLLANVGASSLGVGVAFVCKVCSSLALPLETIMLSLIANDLFGSVSFDKVLGIISAFNTAGYALGSPLSNAFYDVLGTYVPVFYIFAVAMVLVAVLFQWSAVQAQKVRQTVQNAQ